MRTKVLLNTSAGTLTGNDVNIDLVEDLFRRFGIHAEIVPAPDLEIREQSRRAVETKPGLILAGGGDGTISAVASALANTGINLGILPLGTLNHFAKDLQIPLKLEEAVELIAKGPVRSIDMGEVNGHYFINNSSLGVYPRLVKNREEQRLQLGIGKWPALLIAAFLVFRRVSDFKVEIISEDMHVIRKTPFVFVGNNQYDVSLFTIRNRSSLNRGVLSIYIGNRGGRLELLRLMLRAITGKLEQAKDFTALTLTECLIRTKAKHITIAVDGELLKMSTPLHYRIHPGALRVIAPERTEAGNE
jgi:diacylglycerol kinase family enzyme